MDKIILKSVERVTEIKWFLDEVRTTLDLAIQADARGDDLGNVVCLSLRELKRISEKLNNEIEKMQAWNREGEQDAETV